MIGDKVVYKVFGEGKIIAIDIFREKLHNKGVDKENKYEEWLTFGAELDKNTVQYIIGVGKNNVQRISKKKQTTFNRRLH